MDLSNPAQQSAEEIFPVEVWEHILDNLKSTTDLENCSQTCTAWKEILLAKRTTFLMPKVFPILFEYLLDAPVGARDDADKSKEKWRQWKRKSTDILKMRFISTAWKESVDAYYQNHYVFNDTNFVEKVAAKQEHEVLMAFNLIPYHFEIFGMHATLENFLGKNFPPESNPYITRYVNYNDDKYNRGALQHQYRTNFKKLLESFGSNIWNCALKFTTDSSLCDLYQLVRSFLSLMPNLRSLEIYYTLGSYGDPYNARRLKSVEWLLKNKYPKMEHLVKLHLDSVPYLISVGILAQNEQLRNLSINNDYGWTKQSIPDPVVDVKTLKLEQLVFFSHSNEDLAQLQKLAWPLKALHVHLHLSMCGRKQWANLFQTLSTFKDSLEHLILTLSYCARVKELPGDADGLKELRLELPNLKKFKLKAPLELMTIDFLAECTALQEIELCIKIKKSNEEGKRDDDVLDEDTNSDMIQFESCITSMHKSNVWTILPALQLLKIDRWILDRDIHIKTTPGARFTRRHNEKYVENLNRVA